jgi:hypothetical protein
MAARRERRRVLAVKTSGRFSAILDSKGDQFLLPKRAFAGRPVDEEER